MDYYRLAAIAVGALIFLYPFFSKFIPKARSAPMSSAEITQQDLETVLHLAHRLRKVGCEDGSRLCQQLLELMLNHGVR
jgi:hypothetical protein